jgi:hypothetical protein
MSAWAAEVGDSFFIYSLFFTDFYGLVLRDVRERGRDIDGIIKQWFSFVKPSCTKYVAPQRGISGWSMIFGVCTW